MQRTSNWIGLWVGFGLLTLGATAGWAARPVESLLPKTTVGILAITNVDDLNTHWKQMQLGKLMDDPIMAAFRKDFRKQTQQNWASLRERMGLTLDDLRGVPTGEAALAMIEPKLGEAAIVALADVTGHVPQAEAMLKKAAANLLKQGAKQSTVVINGYNVAVFELPIATEEQLPATRDGQPAAAVKGPAVQPDRTIYVLADHLLIAADNLEVVRGILGRLAKGPAGSLAEVPGFQAVMKRCATDGGRPATHQVRWFLYPLGYAEAAHTINLKEKGHHRGKTVVEVMRNQGFGAIKGVGGFVDLAADGFELLHRTAVYAPPPYEKSTKMLVFPNAENFTPQPWVPRDVASYTTLYFDIKNAFDNFGPLFDELFGEGEKGVWEDTLKSLKTDPNGPKIDLRKELILNLGRRVTMISDYQLPITTSSERLLFAIETTDDKAVAQAVKKCMQNDSTVKRRVVSGHVIWEIVEEEQPKVPSISLELPAVGGKKDKDKSKDKDIEPGPGLEEEKEQTEKEGHFLPHGAVTVANGQLYIASHLDFLLKILKPIAKKDTLAESPEYRKVADTVGKLGFSKQSVSGFSRTDEQFRPTYELIRQGKMPESESLLGRTLNTFSGAAKKGVVRSQRINGKNLPDFEVMRRALGLGGVGATSEADGWFLKGFMLPK